MKSAVLTGIAMALASVTLASCQQAADQPASEPTEAAPEAPAGITVANGRLVLPPVEGNPGAVYFDITNNGEGDAQIASAAVEGAGSAMLHTTVKADGMASMQHLNSVLLPKGGSVTFAPGGHHVMAMDLADTVKAGTQVEVTLTFADGDKVSFPAQVRAAGDAN